MQTKTNKIIYMARLNEKTPDSYPSQYFCSSIKCAFSKFLLQTFFGTFPFLPIQFGGSYSLLLSEMFDLSVSASMSFYQHKLYIDLQPALLFFGLERYSMITTLIFCGCFMLNFSEWTTNVYKSTPYNLSCHFTENRKNDKG